MSPCPKARKCGSGKVSFLSQGEANRALERIKLTEQQAAVHVETYPRRAYRCRCGKFHLTSQEQRTEPAEGREVAKRQPRRRRGRRGRSDARSSALRHLTVPAVKVKARRDLWRTRADELARLNAQSRNTFPWRSAA